MIFFFLLVLTRCLTKSSFKPLTALTAQTRTLLICLKETPSKQIWTPTGSLKPRLNNQPNFYSCLTWIVYFS